MLIGISAFLLTGNPAKFVDRRARRGAGFALLTGCMIATYTVWDDAGTGVTLRHAGKEIDVLGGTPVTLPLQPRPAMSRRPQQPPGREPIHRTGGLSPDT